ncbi:hypothetical protein WJX73_001077 [Symbiochloris irregularis]|uniref:TAFII55 protein conserved region domain-containing protein n=1 Tax=Symbiochloris irregularis TaxID=706552 RepID=A0AAW1P2Q2_9CHLO
MTFEGTEYAFTLLDLPTILETYKTYNDSDLVKSNDIGQVILVREKSVNLDNGTEYKHGITPPMRDVRNRMFRPTEVLDRDKMKQLAHSLVSISAGSAPEGMEFADVEEEYQGKWVWPYARPGMQSAEEARKPG